MTIVALVTLARGARRRKTDRRTACWPPGGWRAAPTRAGSGRSARADAGLDRRARSTARCRPRASRPPRSSAAGQPVEGGARAATPAADGSSRPDRGCSIRSAWRAATAGGVERGHRPGSARTSSPVCRDTAPPARRQQLETLADALATFTAAQYGPSARARSARALDEALVGGDRGRAAGLRTERLLVAAAPAHAARGGRPWNSRREHIRAAVRTSCGRASPSGRPSGIDDLQFWHRSEARLALVGLVGLALVLLIVRGR